MDILFIRDRGIRQIYFEDSKNDRKKDIHSRIRKRRKNIAAARREKLMAKMRSPLLITAIIGFVALMGYISVQDNYIADTGLAFAAQAAEDTRYEYVIVRNGDTLWGIAGEYSDPSNDIRNNIKDICKINGIQPGKIYPGQIIIVPIPASMY